MIDADARKKFEEWGPLHLRTRIESGTIPPGWLNQGLEWLSEYDATDRAETRASILEQARLARSANRAAWIAAVAAIIAVIVTIIGAAITYLAWLFPHV